MPSPYQGEGVQPVCLRLDGWGALEANSPPPGLPLSKGEEQGGRGKRAFAFPLPRGRCPAGVFAA
ncbi:MAG: hypothetical protein ACLFSB_11470, partial [Chitinispirillaceae bacterium]